MIICGVDPGLSGGLAVLWDRNEVQSQLVTFDLPVRLEAGVSDRLDGVMLGNWVRAWGPDLVIIEEAQAMPKQGVSSTFTYGQAYGTAIGVFEDNNVNLHLVRPSVWKRQLGLQPPDKDMTPAQKTSQRKRSAMALASELYPEDADQWSRLKDNHRAEAALLAHWGSKFHGYL